MVQCVVLVVLVQYCCSSSLRRHRSILYIGGGSYDGEMSFTQMDVTYGAGTGTICLADGCFENYIVNLTLMEMVGMAEH